MGSIFIEKLREWFLKEKKKRVFLGFLELTMRVRILQNMDFKSRIQIRALNENKKKIVNDQGTNELKKRNALISNFNCINLYNKTRLSCINVAYSRPNCWTDWAEILLWTLISGRGVLSTKKILTFFF